MLEKFIPIQGIELTDSILVPLKIKHIYNESHIYYDEIKFLTYKDYTNFINNNEIYVINSSEISECDSIAMYTSQSHNTIEVFNIKLLVSALYFANRLTDTDGLKEKYIEDFIIKHSLLKKIDKKIHDKLNTLANKEYNRNEDEFFKNYILQGYWVHDYIKSDKWYVKLGNHKINRDDFDQFITRGFSLMLCDEYDRQINFKPKIVKIDTNEVFLSYLSIILTKVNEEDEYSKKLKSVLKIYYNVLGIIDIDNLIVSYITILEALLLKKSEQRAQKNIVAARSACLVADNQCKNRKTFIADIIACLYSYRNQIVHEGKTFLELADESTLTIIVNSTKHIIYLVIKYILIHDIKNVNEIKKIVKRNLENDNLETITEYITFIKGNPIKIIYDLGYE